MLLAKLLEQTVRQGELTLVDAAGRSHRFGRRNGVGLRSTIRLHDKALHRRLLVNPKLAFGEAYMDGTLTIEDGTLYDFLDLMLSNLHNLEETSVGRIGQWMAGASRRFQQYNPVGRARNNVAHHYDLSGALYDLFLDKDRQYSCAYFTNNNESLEVAQDNKKRHLAAKLLLKPGMKVLDIGSGWGGLGLFLARVGGADVTGVTLSKEQHDVSQQRARDARLAKQVRFHLKDYREEDGTYDRIVSVGMFEHVGAVHYREFFEKMKDLLKEDGIAVLHSIGRSGPPGTTSPWLRKYIFPGGYTPALSETLAAIEEVGLYVTDIEVLRQHYAETLREWNRRFQQNRDKVAALYDERFCRMWEFYLQGCEISFRRLGQMVFQIQLARRQDAAPLTRDYIAEWEQAHLTA